MGMVGEVVFCVDCDSTRNEHMSSASMAVGSVGGALPVEPPPRRMATKRDGTDALCTACLDARLLRRRTAFVQHKDASPPSPPEPVFSLRELPRELPVRKASAVRIVRVRSNEEPAPPPTARAPKRAAPEAVATPAAAPAKRRTSAAGNARAQRAHDRKLERELAELAVELGFLRTHELLGQLKARVLSRGAAPPLRSGALAAKRAR